MDRILASDMSTAGLDRVRRTLEAGGIVCFPTDTLYGLAVDSSNEKALERIYEVKRRPETKPILLLVDSLRMAQSVSRPNATFDKVARALWPGPITLITWAAPGLSENLTAGTGTVGLRWPQHRLALDIVRSLNRPITATSANLSGMPAARSTRDVVEQVGAGIDLMIDGDPLPRSEPSTVLDLTRETPTLLREGAVSMEAIRVVLDGAIEGARHES